MESPVKFTGLIPALETWSMNATLMFYTETLGFTIDGKMENKGDIFWVMLRRDNVWIIFAKPNEVEGNVRAKLTGNLYIYANDVDTIWTFVKDRAEVVYPIEDFKYGMREFAIRDNN
eukprot:gene10754-14425_t